MKILLAIDNSKFPEAATQAVIAQIRPPDTKIRVLHVSEPLVVGEFAEFDVNLETEIKKTETLVAKVADTLRAQGFDVTTPVEQGDPRSRIIDCAAEWSADLIVLGSHGRTGLDRFLLGSISEAVARHAPCSVEIVRLPSGPQSER